MQIGRKFALRTLVPTPEPPSYSSVRVSDGAGNFVREISTATLQARKPEKAPAPQLSRRSTWGEYPLVLGRTRSTPDHPRRGRGGKLTLTEGEL